MKDIVGRLAHLRHSIAEQENMIAGAEAALRTTAQWAEVERRSTRLQETKKESTEAEAEVRKQALGVYEETGDKAPHPAVTIKMYTVLDYQEINALSYAREHLPQALKLDKRTFETAAKVLDLGFVDIVQEPRATIARDLSGYLPED